MINDKVEVEKLQIIDLISCAETYGFDDSLLIGSLFMFLGYNLTPEEIEEYAQDLSSQTGYGIEDYEETVKTLKDYAIKYNKNEVSK